MTDTGAGTTAGEILGREYLEVRAALISLGAALDRLARGAGGPADLAHDPRIAQIRAALQVLADDSDDDTRAQRIQMLFSRPYDPKWQSRFQLERSG